MISEKAKEQSLWHQLFPRRPVSRSHKLQDGQPDICQALCHPWRLHATYRCGKKQRFAAAMPWWERANCCLNNSFQTVSHWRKSNLLENHGVTQWQMILRNQHTIENSRNEKEGAHVFSWLTCGGSHRKLWNHHKKCHDNWLYFFKTSLKLSEKKAAMAAEFTCLRHGWKWQEKSGHGRWIYLFETRLKLSEKKRPWPLNLLLLKQRWNCEKKAAMTAEFTSFRQTWNCQKKRQEPLNLSSNLYEKKLGAELVLRKEFQQVGQ